MRSTPVALVNYMAGTSAKLAELIKLTRTDGVVLAVTNHDQDIVYAGTTYRAALGFNSLAVPTSAYLSVDTLDVRGFLSLLGITESDIAAGLWDYCDVRVFRVNWDDVTMGAEKVSRGWIGDISVGRNEFTAEVRSMAQKLQGNILRFVKEHCDADLFDARCQVPETEGVWKFSGVAVSTVVAAQREFTCAALGQAPEFFTGGKVRWTAGDNDGITREVKRHLTGGVIRLQEQTPYTIAPGDVVTVWAGCQKRYDEDCIAKFANGDNFRAFPFLPGKDAVRTVQVGPSPAAVAEGGGGVPTRGSDGD